MRLAPLPLLLLLLAAGCYGYQPGSFTHAADPHSSARATVDCLDVAIERGWDAAASGPIARIAVANRCDRPVELDLGAIRAVARTGDGAMVPHRAHDPRGEIRPALLDGRSVATELIEYRPEAGRAPPLADLCFDISALARPPARPVSPLCLDGAGAIAELGR